MQAFFMFFLNLNCYQCLIVFAIIKPQVVICSNHQNVLMIAAKSDSFFSVDIFSPIVLHHNLQILFMFLLIIKKK